MRSILPRAAAADPGEGARAARDAREEERPGERQMAGDRLADRGELLGGRQPGRAKRERVQRQADPSGIAPWIFGYEFFEATAQGGCGVPIAKPRKLGDLLVRQGHPRIPDIRLRLAQESSSRCWADR